MNCPKCNTETHIDSTGVISCLCCGYRVEPYNNAGLMKREEPIPGTRCDRNLPLDTNDVVEDSINPNHYTSFAIAPNEYITANELEWEVGNVIKYVSRYKKKNGKEDLLKAIKYIELLIEREYPNEIH